MDIGYVHVLPIVNSAAVNIGGTCFFLIMVFSGYMPRGEIAGSYISSIFSFQGNSILFSTVAVPIHIPTISAGRFLFLHTLSSI